MKYNLNIGFRVDSGLNIGEGHLSRCLTVATSLKKYTKRIHFYCTSIKNNSNFLVKKIIFLEQIKTDNNDINFFLNQLIK